MVRMGSNGYGNPVTEGVTAADRGLRPVLTLGARVVRVKRVAAGHRGLVRLHLAGRARHHAGPRAPGLRGRGEPPCAGGGPGHHRGPSLPDRGPRRHGPVPRRRRRRRGRGRRRGAAVRPRRRRRADHRRVGRPHGQHPGGGLVPHRGARAAPLTWGGPPRGTAAGASS